MNNLHAAGSNVFVRLDSAVQDRITFKSGAQIFLPGTFETEKWATCQGIVTSIGARCDLGLQVGDIVAIDYRLISDYDRKGEIIVYNRLVESEGQSVWRAEDWMIMGVMREGEWQAIGNWAIMKEIKELTFQSELIQATELSTVIKKGCGKLVSGSDAPAGSTAYFPEKFRSLYTFPDGRTFIIIDSRHILAYA